MKISYKLYAGFLTVAAIVAIAGIIGINTASTISMHSDDIMEKSDIIVDDKVPIKDVAMEATISEISARDALGEYMLSKESELSSIADEIDEYIDDFDMWIAMVEYGTESSQFKSSDAGKMYIADGLDMIVKKGTSEQISLATSADQHHATFTEAAYKLIDAINNYHAASTSSEQDDYWEEAQGWMDTADTASLDALSYLDDLEGNADQEISNAMAAADAAMVSADAAYDSSYMMLLTTVAIGVIAAIVIGVFITRMISNPLKKVANVISSNDFSKRCEINQNDEVGIVAKSVDDLFNNIAEPVKQMAEKSFMIADGDLTVNLNINAEGDVGKLADGFKKMVTNLQNVIGNIKKSASETASAAEELSSSAEEVNASTEQTTSTIQQIATGASTAATNTNQV